MRWRCALALIVLVVLCVCPPAAAQQAGDEGSPSGATPPTTGVCSIRDSRVCAGLGAATADSSGEVEVVRAGASATKRRVRTQPRIRWERSSLADERGPGEFAGCIQPVTGLAGILHEDRRVDLTTGRTLQVRTVCLADPIPMAPATPPTPRPPAERIWSEVPLPEPTWGLSPAIDGLTGLPTHLWDPRGGAPISASVDLGGFTATATARPVVYEWTMWEPDDPENRNPHPFVVSRIPGSESEPAATYTYETKGDYTVTQTVTWAGTYTLTGPGVNEVVDLGTTATTSSRTYHVTEVRAVLRG